jgi:hypothetical protein
MFFADEANPEQTDPNRFFIYGAVFVPVEKISSIHVEIEKLRQRYTLGIHDQLKFNTRSKPKQMTAVQHTEMKSEVYKIALENDVKFCGYAILHAIAKNKEHKELVEWGANIILAKFNQFLGESGATGWANFDRINTDTPYVFLQEKFSYRLRDDGAPVQLENILGYSFTCDNASHIASLADVLIGGFRYIINEPEKDIAGRAIVSSLGPLFWGKIGTGGVNFIGDRGLVLRPKDVKAVAYQADYAEIRSRLTAWSKQVSDHEPN